jgi:uncharacterized coiled-coil protein SlyX
MLVQERAKALKPIQKRMAEVESQIEKLEKKLDEDNDLLIEASTAEQAALITKYSKSIAEHQQKIEQLFHELDVLSKELHSEQEKFDK